MPMTSAASAAPNGGATTDQCWRATRRGRSPGINCADIVLPRISNLLWTLVQNDGRACAKKRTIWNRIFQPAHAQDEQHERGRSTEKNCVDHGVDRADVRRIGSRASHRADERSQFRVAKTDAAA